MPINNTWASSGGATVTEPSAVDQTNGFQPGPADPAVFNWLFFELTAATQDVETRLTNVEEATGATAGIGPDMTRGSII